MVLGKINSPPKIKKGKKIYINKGYEKHGILGFMAKNNKQKTIVTGTYIFK